MVLCWQKSKKIFLGKGDAIKLDEFLENFQMAFDSPPHFWKIILRFLLQIWLHICEEWLDSMKCMHMISRDKDHSDFSQYDC